MSGYIRPPLTPGRVTNLQAPGAAKRDVEGKLVGLFTDLLADYQEAGLTDDPEELAEAASVAIRKAARAIVERRGRDSSR